MASPLTDESLSIGLEELPKPVQEKFDGMAEPEESLHTAVASDMDMEGMFEDSWLLATDRRILVLSGNHSKPPDLIHEVPIKDISEINVKNYVGNGILEVETGDKSVELLRFSKTAYHRNGISDLPHVIDKLREKNGHTVKKREGGGVDQGT